MAKEQTDEKKGGFLSGLGRFITRFFIVIGIAATISMALLSITLSRAMTYTPPPLPEQIVLYYDFELELAEVVTKPSFSHPLFRPPTTLHEVIGALDKAKEDERVKGFIARVSGPRYSIAQYQELKDAIKSFRDTGRFAYVYADSIGGMSTGMGAYYLASSFDEIWLQPVGMVSVTGLAMEVPFMRALLDKVGVKPEVMHRGKYKSMPETFTRNDMSPPHREMMDAITGDLFDQLVSGVAVNRGIEKDKLLALIDNAPLTDQEALEAGLVDRLGYSDEMIELAKQKAAGDTPKRDENGKEIEPGVVSLTGYAFHVQTQHEGSNMVDFVTNYYRKIDPRSQLADRPKIALVYGSGAIVASENGAHMDLGGGNSMDAGKIAKALKAASEDEDVRAIVFRIESPGGSPSASETIRRAVLNAKKKGKPVVVSMGGAAASGGYWIATDADRIVAQPATLTGSIGVFGGRPDAREMWNKIGISWDSVSYGKHADMWSINGPFKPSERERVSAMMDRLYDAFLTRVSAGRGLDRAKVEQLAQGRVWTGRQAKENGLVDDLGGLKRAIEVARELGGIEEGEKSVIERFPAPRSTLEMLVKLAQEGAVGPLAPKISTPELRRMASEIAPLLADPADNMLYMMPVFVRAD